MARSFVFLRLPAPLRAAASTLLPLLLCSLAASCSSTADDATRKCYEQIQAISPSSDGQSCGVRAPLTVSVCEKLPETRCSSATPNHVCVSTPGDRGFLLELSPCGELQSLPNGWTLASEYAAGVNAEKECKKAETLCSGGSVAPGSGGSGGSGGLTGPSRARRSSCCRALRGLLPGQIFRVRIFRVLI